MIIVLTNDMIMKNSTSIILCKPVLSYARGIKEFFFCAMLMRRVCNRVHEFYGFSNRVSCLHNSCVQYRNLRERFVCIRSLYTQLSSLVGKKVSTIGKFELKFSSRKFWFYFIIIEILWNHFLSSARPPLASCKKG